MDRPLDLVSHQDWDQDELDDLSPTSYLAPARESTSTSDEHACSPKSPFYLSLSILVKSNGSKFNEYNAEKAFYAIGQKGHKNDCHKTGPPQGADRLFLLIQVTLIYI